MKVFIKIVKQEEYTNVLFTQEELKDWNKKNKPYQGQQISTR